MPLVFIFTSARIIDHASSCRDRLAWSTVDRADRVSFSVEVMVEATMLTRISGLLFLVKICRARGKLATGSILSLWP